MKISDILRDLADKLANIEQGRQTERPSNTEKSADDFQHEVDVIDKEEEGNGTGMIPPLQQKLELLKKATGVDSAFDDEGNHDELDDIKKLTGIKAVIHHIDDTDLEGQ